MVGPLTRGEERACPVNCTTKVSGLQVASIVDGDAALRAVRDTAGHGIAVPDEASFDIQSRLAREEGLFCEPAAAITVAGAAAARAAGLVEANAVCVCLLTGSAFKDTDSLERMASGAVPLLGVTDL